MAHDLFLSRGYGSVTIQEIADAAGVSAQMIYASFGSKAGILEFAANIAIVGDDEEIALADRASTQNLFLIDEPRAFVRAFVDGLVELHERSARILHLVQTVAGSDPQVAALEAAFEEGRRIDGRRVLEALPAEGRRDDVDLERLREGTNHLLSPSGYVYLVDQYGWTPEQYGVWMEDLLHHLAYGPPRDGK
ncbi:MAG TPA: helix-turn-helix domain-containing protein [Microthrixaceae bacterium]|nr:helix-turn-helix domain-containing protein [Microthrixaceae bacterium]